MSRVIRARWILPIDRPPVENGWVQMADGRVVAVGEGRPPAAPDDLGDVAVLPGLVNAHTHLELSWMAGLVPPSGSMNAWIRALVRLRRAGPGGGAAAEHAAARQALAAAAATGTVLVGDISNRLDTPAFIREAGLGGVVFHELLGFAVDDAAGEVRRAWDRVHVIEAGLAGIPGSLPIDFSVVAHAPYSVAPALFTEIARQSRGAPLTVHLAESHEEVQFLKTGRGPIRHTLEALGVWTDWPVPDCDPVTFIARLGYLQRGLLVAHGVHLTDDALERLRAAGAVLVTCPRSNEWVGAGTPRLSHFYASRVPVAIGTDSLASSPSLSLFDELAEMRRIAPDVSAAKMLESATRVGAEALGFGADFGTLAVGKRARFTVVDVPAGERDVEEYLVSGVPAGRVRAAA